MYIYKYECMKFKLSDIQTFTLQAKNEPRLLRNGLKQN